MMLSSLHEAIFIHHILKTKQRSIDKSHSTSYWHLKRNPPVSISAATTQ